MSEQVYYSVVEVKVSAAAASLAEADFGGSGGGRFWWQGRIFALAVLKSFSFSIELPPYRRQMIDRARISLLPGCCLKNSHEKSPLGEKRPTELGSP